MNLPLLGVGVRLSPPPDHQVKLRTTSPSTLRRGAHRYKAATESGWHYAGHDAPRAPSAAATTRYRIKSSAGARSHACVRFRAPGSTGSGRQPRLMARSNMAWSRETTRWARIGAPNLALRRCSRSTSSKVTAATLVAPAQRRQNVQADHVTVVGGGLRLPVLTSNQYAHSSPMVGASVLAPSLHPGRRPANTRPSRMSPRSLSASSRAASAPSSGNSPS